MKTKEEIEKEIGENYKSKLQKVYDHNGKEKYKQRNYKRINELKALLQQSKEFIGVIDKWLSIFIMNNDCEFCNLHKSKLEEIKSSIIGSEEK